MAASPKNVALVLSLALCFFGVLGSFAGFVLGIVLGCVLGSGINLHVKRGVPWCLAFAVIGLGAGMDIAVVSRQGLSSVLVTLVSIGFTFLVSHGITRWLKTSWELALLLSSGTAICGGSAIAAVSSVIRAKPESMAVALSCVFILNSAALLLFPSLGIWMKLSEREFGLWSALAIHDTSSVVGSALEFGSLALTIATSTKLVRALWIAPMSLVIAVFFDRQGGAVSVLKKQWFVVAFILLSCVFSWVGWLKPYRGAVTDLSKRLMVVTLFLIGTGFSVESMKCVGIKPLIHSFVLWISMAIISLLIIKSGWI